MKFLSHCLILIISKIVLLVNLGDLSLDYLNKKENDQQLLKKILTSGTIDGLFTYDEVDSIFNVVSSKYSEYISKKIIGRSYKNIEILSYKMGNNLSTKQNSNKSSILFTAVHHARELLSMSMIIFIFLSNLHHLIHETQSLKKYWLYIDMIFVPIINPDGVIAISKAWKTENWEEDSLIRKNQNDSYTSKHNHCLIGVDLNRNYSVHFSSSERDKDPCSITYQGPYSFSEPETQAIRKLLSEEENIMGAMNFHCYGNMWIHPFNYMPKPDQYPPNFNPALLDFYIEFGKNLKKISDGRYGNAVGMVDYQTDGEGSDYMLAEFNILSFSPELGLNDNRSNTFYPDKNMISPIIYHNYEVVELFLSQVEPSIEEFDYSYKKGEEILILFRNNGIADIFELSFEINSNSKEGLNCVERITITDQKQMVTMGIVYQDKFKTIARLKTLKRKEQIIIRVVLKTGMVINDDTPIEVIIKNFSETILLKESFAEIITLIFFFNCSNSCSPRNCEC